MLVGAAELIDARGYHGVSMAEIIQTVGAPETSVYFHFPTLDAVATGLVELQYEQWRQVVDEAAQRLEAGKFPLEVAVALSFVFARRLRDDLVSRAGVRLAQEAGALRSGRPDPFDLWTGQTATLLAAARDAGDLAPSVDPDAAARAVVGACYGATRLAVATDGVPAGGLAVEGRLGDLWALLLGGLAPATARPAEVVAHGRELADDWGATLDDVRALP